jgi:transposase InsO family protein
LRCEDLVAKCKTCQKSKLPQRGYGELPPRNAIANPWYTVAVDLISPWSLYIQMQKYKFMALTCIDVVTNYCEIIRVNDKSSLHIGTQFENQWLARYLRPIECIYNQGGEFLGQGFQDVLRKHNICSRPIRAKNPQANAIVE